ncbi:quinoprotein dehydrogenase-associated SoxYZ-like carrier [Azohydromonas sediminis]|uniref:quinoprotein dehydrogenase-associated SoxYZ-like carrier n=1 Tax=Azohydromonas sediminis TaxID=2259674 RepID=UPI000E64E80D|nr:quinoprotein dehydrogenase-associated SoxYZ-like carrier [Azohydromonas sediminis]
MPDPALPRRRLLSLLGAITVPAAFAAPGGLPAPAAHTDSSPEFERVRQHLFGSRPITAKPSRVELVVPLRAAFGASVPVKVVSKLPQTPALYVRRLYLVVDKNPAPVVAVLDLTPELGQADFETRLRVDEYSHVRAIAELSDGQLHMDSRYVKVSGGCSAPPNRERPDLIGKTILRLPEGVRTGAPTPAEVQVIHPNDTGFELNHVTVMFIPPHYVRELHVTWNGRRLFDAELTFAIAENPMFRFHFVPRGPGELRAEVDDTKGLHYSGRLLVD